MSAPSTRFYWDERCFWHAGGAYAFTAPVGGLVQPLAAGGLPENPETKRRLVNLMRVTGLLDLVDARGAEPADDAALRRVHPASYLEAFQSLSDAGGGELGERTPFLSGGYEIAALSAGLVRTALADVLAGRATNAYALSRPPGHHCLPDRPMGFCLLANIAIAVEAAIAEEPSLRVAVLDWDVHHGNGTQAIFAERPDVLALSIHQENNYPFGSGGADERGEGAGAGATLNVPLPPGGGDATYLRVMDRIVAPALRRFQPDLIVVACGLDASGIDPLGRMLVSAAGFEAMTARIMDLAADLCGGKLVLAHEGGYAEAHAPFCGHAVIARLAGADVSAPDPFAARLAAQQPTAAFQSFLDAHVDALTEAFGLK